MTIGPLRLKLLLAEHGRSLAFGLAAAAILAFAASGWVFATPPTHDVTDQTHRQTITTDVNTSATVTGNSSLWTRGTTLTNQSIYPMTAPQLTLQVRTAVPSGERVQVRQRLALVYRASRDDTVFWRSERQLVSTRTTTADGAVTASATLDIPSIRNRVSTFNSELTGLGRVDTRLVLQIDYETARYAGELSKAATLAIANNGYWLDGQLRASTTHSQTVTRQVEGEPDPVLLFGFAGLGLVCTAGAGAVWIFQNRDIDYLTLQDRLDRARFEEWISEGQLDRPHSERDIAVNSLADLVDIAIDSNKRVIHDPARDRYAVMDGQVTYRFDPYEDPTVLRRDEPEADRIRNSLDTLFEDDHPDQPTDAWENLLTRDD